VWDCLDWSYRETGMGDFGLHPAVGFLYQIFMNHLTRTPTPQAQKLADALRQRDITVITEYDDGYKHVDIYLPQNQMYIEVEGLQHFVKAKQIISDLQRDYYSDQEKRFTFRVPNHLIEEHLNEIANAIENIVKKHTLVKS
jgi:very-short-patch-repair endonuclease